MHRSVKPWVEIVLIGLSATLLTLGFSGFEIPAVAWVALVPLLLLLKRSGPRHAFLASLAVGCLFYSGLLWWVLRLTGFHALNFSLGILANAAYVGIFGVVALYWQRRLPGWNALALPATWVVLEYLRSQLGFLAFPWGILGYSQYTVLPVAQIATFTGVYGVSFLIVTVNTVLAEIIHPYLVPSRPPVLREIPWRQRITLGVLSGAVIFWATSFLYGLPSAVEKESSPVLHVALVQGNPDTSETNFARHQQTTLQTYARLTLQAAHARPDLIAWPSSSVPGRIPHDAGLVAMLSRLAQMTETFLLIGTSGYEKFGKDQKQEQGVANSAFLISPRGEILARYDKIHLLPFDEYLPLRGYVQWPSWLVNAEMTDRRPGTEFTIFRLDKGKFGVLICWENLFPDLFRKMAAQGVDFMLSMTNEEFTDVPAAHYQMLAMNVFRAIENRVSIVRTATTGVSSIIAPNGRIMARVQDDQGNDVNVSGYLVGQIPLSAARTVYSRYGDWFVYSLCVMLGGLMMLAILGKPPFTPAGPAAHKAQERHGRP